MKVVKYILAWLVVAVMCLLSFRLGQNAQWDELVKNHHLLVLFNGENIAVPDDYKKVIEYDSIQLVFGGRGKYNEAKQDYDVTWDSL